MSTDATTTEPTLAQKQAAALRLLADMIEQNPQVAENFEHHLSYSGLFMHASTGDVPAEMAAFGRIARRYGATTEKSVSETQFNLVCDFGALKLKFLANRGEVCELKVVGTREVVEEVPDPEALAAVPTATVKRTEEITEWVCSPLLAAAEEPAAVAS